MSACTLWRNGARLETWLREFLTSALGGGEWSTSRACRFNPEKERRYKLGGGQSRSWRFFWIKEKICCPCRDSDPGLSNIQNFEKKLYFIALCQLHKNFSGPIFRNANYLVWKLAVAESVKTVPIVSWNSNFITVFAKDRHRLLSWTQLFMEVKKQHWATRGRDNHLQF